MHLVLSHVTSLPRVPVLSAALLVLLGTALVLRSRGSNGRSSRSSRSRHSGGPRVTSRFAAAPDPRFAAHSRFAPNPRGHFAAAQSITAAQPFVAAQPSVVAPHFAAAQSITAAQPFAAAPPSVLAPHFAAAQSVTAAQPFVAAPQFAVAQSIAATQPFAAPPRLSPDAGDLFVVRPDLHVVSTPDLRVVVTAPPPSVPPAITVSVLPALTENDKGRPSFAPSNSGDAFPTRARALSLLVGHTLAVLGILILSLAGTPIGRHMSHVGSTSVGFLATLGVLVGFALAVAATARIQHDIMGGGWDAGFSPRLISYLSYISPQVARYVISPSGIAAAARRLNLSPARVILVQYGLAAASVLIVLDRYVAR